MPSGFYDVRNGTNVDAIQEVLDSCVSYSYLDANFPNMFDVGLDTNAFMCGGNSQGSLGLSDRNNRDVFTSIPNIKNIKQISGSDHLTYILLQDGIVLATGYNIAGALGRNTGGSGTGVSTFTSVPGLSNIKRIAGGLNYGIALKTDGTVWSVGINGFGQLGLSDTNSRSTFTSVPGLTNITNIFCNTRTFALKQDGTVWAAGKNDSGELGLSDTNSRSTFQSVTGLTNIKSMSTGVGHSIALKTDGTIFAAGNNTYSQLGLEDWAQNRSTFTSVPNITNVKATACGNYNTLILKTDGTVWGCGYNTFFQLGIPDSDIKVGFNSIPGISNIKDISAGVKHTIALKSDGTVFGCGDNAGGQCGPNFTGVYKSPVLATFTGVKQVDYSLTDGNEYNKPVLQTLNVEATLIIKNDGTLWASGTNTAGILGLNPITNWNYNPSILPISGIKQVDYSLTDGNENNKSLLTTPSGYHEMVIKSDGSVWGIGLNTNNQLGLFDKTDRSKFTSIPYLNNIKSISGGANHTIALKSDGTVWTVGANSFGQLGLSDQTMRSFFTSVPNINNVKAISATSNGTFALKADGTVWSVGQNSNAELGLSDTNNRSTFTSVPIINNIKNISTGTSHTIALNSIDGSVWVTGQNSKGQLGLGNILARSTFQSVPGLSNIISIAATGNSQSCSFIIKADGNVMGCGDNTNGQLGFGDLVHRSTFTSIPGLSSIKAISGGNHYNIALKIDGTLWSCGYNTNGGLGLSDNIKRSTFTSIPNLVNINSFSCRYDTTFASDTSGNLYGFGNTIYNSISNNIHRIITTTSTFTSVPIINNVKSIVGRKNSIALKTDGTIWACGYNFFGGLGLSDITNRSTFTSVPGLSSVKSVACGNQHSIALQADGTVWTVGNNNNGNLGLSDNIIRSTFTSVPGLSDVKSVACGGSHNIALQSNGTVWGCGQNANGQLGLNDVVPRSTFTSVTGLSDVKSIACGYYYSIALKTDGTVWAAGFNTNGQLGLNNAVHRSTFTSVTMISDVKAIACGGTHSIALKSDGTVWTVGNNANGQLGLSDLTSRSTFTSVPNLVNINSIAGNHNGTFVSDTTGKLYVFGTDNSRFGLATTSMAPSFQSIPTINSIKAIMPGNGTATSSGYLTFPSSSDSIFKVWN
jgi:alpha-tubulin suppressor-like RCC1 family protein